MSDSELNRGATVTPECTEIPADFPAFSHDIDINLPDWPIREDQRPTGMCVAYAVAACAEHQERATSANKIEFSAQFLFWAIKTHSSDKEPTLYRTKLWSAHEALQSIGICTSDLHARVESDGTEPDSAIPGPLPSPPALRDALLHKFRATRYCDYPKDSPRSPKVAENLWYWLEVGKRPVAICVPIFSTNISEYATNWTNEGLAAEDGLIANPLTKGYDKQTVRAHCVCVTGFVADPENVHRGYFIFRNSYGPNWARKRRSTPFISQPGYGALTVDYVENYCWEMMQL